MVSVLITISGSEMNVLAFNSTNLVSLVSIQIMMKKNVKDMIWQ